jgi:hypothetical protein
MRVDTGGECDSLRRDAMRFESSAACPQPSQPATIRDRSAKEKRSSTTNTVQDDGMTDSNTTLIDQHDREIEVSNAVGVQE